MKIARTIPSVLAAALLRQHICETSALVLVAAIALVLSVPVNAAVPREPMPDEEVLPSATDPNIKTFDNPHGIYFPSEQRLRNQLLLFIPGTQPEGRKGEPQKPLAQWFCKVAALNGYHVVYLMYPNDVAAMEACPRSPNRDAFSVFRWAIIEGGNTPYINIPRTECIENRTIKLMEYLQRQHPNQSWGQFVVGGHIAWQKVAVDRKSVV